MMTTIIHAEYMGLQLNSPVIVGACPMTASPESVRELVLSGAGAVVLPSLFQEQVVHGRLALGQATTKSEALVESLFYQHVKDCPYGSISEYFELIASLKRTIGIPLIASLNGCTSGSWLSVAQELQTAGADAIEVSIEPESYDPSLSADAIEKRLIDTVRELCDQTSLPISIKLSPFHTNLSNLAWRLAESGATGLVCFAHDPTWEVHTDSIAASMTWSLTPAGNINPTLSGLLRLRAGGPKLSLAASGGICSPEDMIKTIIAGADVAMVTSELYRSGPDILAHLIDSLAHYLEQHHFATFAEFTASRPASQQHLRSSFLQSLNSPRNVVDPTPQVARQTGDRWGHVQ